jgi:hypothetical protein
MNTNTVFRSASHRVARVQAVVLDSLAEGARLLALLVIGKAINAGAAPFTAVKRLVSWALLGWFGYFAGWHGYGCDPIVHDHAIRLFWHEVVAPASIVGLPALFYSNELIVGFLRDRGVNPFVMALAAFYLYIPAVLLTTLFFGFFAFPFVVLWTIARIALAIARPLLRRAFDSLTPTAADEAAKIVRNMARVSS